MNTKKIEDLTFNQVKKATNKAFNKSKNTKALLKSFGIETLF